jgi:hypothetical protein
MKHLSKEKFSRDNIIEGKKTEKGKKRILGLIELKGTQQKRGKKNVTNTCVHYLIILADDICMHETLTYTESVG